MEAVVLRNVSAIVVLAAVCLAQDPVLRTNARLVLVPVSIADHKGQYLRDFAEEDLALYDDNVAQRIHLEDVILPLSLVIVIQTTPPAQIVLDKLRKVTGMIGPMILGARGEAAVVAFGDEIKVVQTFTSEDADVARAIRHLDSTGEGASIGAAVSASLKLLAERPTERRRVLLLISEEHDLGTSKAQTEALVSLAQKQNVTVYSVTFSPFATQWTNKVPKYCDPPRPQNKCFRCTCGNCGNQCDREDGKPQVYVPPQGNLNIAAVLKEARKAAQVDPGEMLSHATGGLQTGLATRSGLDGVLDRIGHDVHAQYLLSFTPTHTGGAAFHQLRVEVKGRHDLVVRARPGYWQSE